MGSRQRRQLEAEVKELILNYELKIHNYFIASTSALDNPAILQISDSGYPIVNIGHSDYSSNNGSHKVSLSPYMIGETEVTQELWQAVMGSNPSLFPNNPASDEEQIKRPVEKVNWFDCIVFCNELTKKVYGDWTTECVYYSDASFSTVYTKSHAGDVPYVNWNKKGFRLPTEAEWEWAAMGGTNDKWAGTDTQSDLGNYAWYNVTSNSKTHQVARKTANNYGLYDMSGNVFEWCWDWYSNTTPTGGSNPAGASTGTARVLRGGSWYSPAVNVARAYRHSSFPNNLVGEHGLRVVCRIKN